MKAKLSNNELYDEIIQNNKQLFPHNEIKKLLEDLRQWIIKFNINKTAANANFLL